LVYWWSETKNITKELTMKKIIITRRFLKESEEKASKIDANLWYDEYISVKLLISEAMMHILLTDR